MTKKWTGLSRGWAVRVGVFFGPDGLNIRTHTLKGIINHYFYAKDKRPVELIYPLCTVEQAYAIVFARKKTRQEWLAMNEVNGQYLGMNYNQATGDVGFGMFSTYKYSLTAEEVEDWMTRIYDDA